MADFAHEISNPLAFVISNLDTLLTIYPSTRESSGRSIILARIEIKRKESSC